MITLSKPITLESMDGASSTIIDLGYPVGGQMVAVNISANDVTFGSRRAGFHVTSRELATQAASGTPRALAGVVVEDQTARAQIRGNLVTKDVDDFSISGIDAGLTDNTAGNNARDGFRLVGEKSVVRRNSSINNIGAGFTLQGSAHRIGLNSAIGNRTCGIVSGSGELDIPEVITKNNSGYP